MKLILIFLSFAQSIKDNNENFKKVITETISQAIIFPLYIIIIKNQYLKRYLFQNDFNIRNIVFLKDKLDKIINENFLNDKIIKFFIEKFQIHFQKVSIYEIVYANIFYLYLLKSKKNQADDFLLKLFDDIDILKNYAIKNLEFVNFMLNALLEIFKNYGKFNLMLNNNIFHVLSQNLSNYNENEYESIARFLKNMTFQFDLGKNKVSSEEYFSESIAIIELMVENNKILLNEQENIDDIFTKAGREVMKYYDNDFFLIFDEIFDDLRISENRNIMNDKYATEIESGSLNWKILFIVFPLFMHNLSN